ncbi:phage tail family protein [Peptoniphilus sp. MSJ-1]|uniref:Phage tail family protein n=1 Tax=Peptoniphilus ovalis TaxID=2841503 RepID=A0ABS6FJI6_9FIRM|nr:phage tail domain-containing protein [Peptoniphilus ovalis]MBU5669662.1 phage tail family protein [Peptoniphilus ovalis]
MQSSEFSFNGIQSYDKGFMNIRMGSEVAKRPLVGTRKINTSNYSNKGIHFIQGVEKEPIEFDLLIAPTEDKIWTRDLYNELISWLVCDEYKEFYSGYDPHKVYYAVCKDYVSWEGLNDYGSIPFSFVTNANHAWTVPERIRHKISGSKTINILNRSVFSDRYCYPRMSIEKTNGSGNVVIENLSDGGYKFELKNLTTNEVIFVDNEYRIIYSIDSPRNVYGTSFNKKWLYLTHGMNKIKITGDCEIIIDVQFPTA